MRDVTRRQLLSTSAASVAFVSGCGQLPSFEQENRSPYLWRTELDLDVTEITLNDTAVLVLAGYDEYSEIFSLHQQSGEQRWSKSLSIGVFSLSVQRDRIYATSGDRSVVSLTPDGSVRWKAQTEERPRHRPAIGRKSVYVVEREGVLQAVDDATGDIRWTASLPSADGSPPAVGGTSIYLGRDDYTVYAIDAESGSQQWTFETEYEVHEKPIYHDGTVYVGGGDERVYALDAKTGEEQWRFEPPRNEISTSPLVSNGTLYVGCADYFVYALDPNSGEEQWRFETFGEVAELFGRGADSFYVRGGGVMYELDPTTGKRRWRSRELRRVQDVRPTQDRFYAADYGNTAYAVSRSAAQTVWGEHDE